MWTLTTLAALPYTMGDLATLIPVEYKPIVLKVSLVAGFILKAINALVQKDKDPTPPQK